MKTEEQGFYLLGFMKPSEKNDETLAVPLTSAHLCQFCYGCACSGV